MLKIGQRAACQVKDVLRHCFKDKLEKIAKLHDVCKQQIMDLSLNAMKPAAIYQARITATFNVLMQFIKENQLQILVNFFKVVSR